MLTPDERRALAEDIAAEVLKGIAGAFSGSANDKTHEWTREQIAVADFTDGEPEFALRLRAGEGAA